MEEVIALIYEIQKIIESQKTKNKEKISTLEDAKERLLQSFNDKSNEYQDLSTAYESLLSEKDSLAKTYEDKEKSFKEKTLGTVKYLVSRIEALEKSDNDKSQELSESASRITELEKHLYDKNSEEKIDLSQYVTLEKYNKDIEKIEANFDAMSSGDLSLIRKINK